MRNARSRVLICHSPIYNPSKQPNFQVHAIGDGNASKMNALYGGFFWNAISHWLSTYMVLSSYPARKSILPASIYSSLECPNLTSYCSWQYMQTVTRLRLSVHMGWAHLLNVSPSCTPKAPPPKTHQTLKGDRWNNNLHNLLCSSSCWIWTVWAAQFRCEIVNT